MGSCIFSLFKIKISMNVHREMPSVQRKHIVLIYQVLTVATARKALVEMASTVLVSFLFSIIVIFFNLFFIVI